MIKTTGKYVLNLFVLLFAFALLNNSYAQYAKSNYKILGIRVEGNVTTDASTIIANSGLKIGDEIEIPGDQTIMAIKRLWRLKIFSDIQILSEKKVGNGIFIVIKLAEHSRIEKFVLVGNDDISESTIFESVNFVTGQIIKETDLYRAVKEIKKLYFEEGFLNPSVSTETYSFASADSTDEEIIATWINKNNPEEEHKTYYSREDYSYRRQVKKLKSRVLVVCNIDEGKESVIRNIEFVGNENFEDDKLASTFDETLQAVWWKFWRSGEFNREEFESDKKLLTTFYHQNGFRDFEILGDSLVVSDDGEDLKIIVTINEGQQYRLRNITWEGNTLFPDEQLNARLRIKKGSVFDYDKFKQNLHGNEKQNDVSALYYDSGYLKFGAVPEEKKVGKDSIDIVIKVYENNRFKVDKVEVTGNTRTQEKVIRRELYTIPGDHFSRSLIFRSLQQLANLKYFNVEKLYKEGLGYDLSSDSTVNISYKVEEKSSDYLNASVGYSEYFGFSGSIGVTLSNFSLAHPFTQGGGQVLNFNWQFGVNNYYRTFSLGFTEPWFMDTPTSLGFSIFSTRQRYYYDLEQIGGSLTVGKRLTWPDNYFYVQGFVKYQSNNVIEGGTYYRQGRSEQFMVGLGISRTDIDNPIFPSRGSKLLFNTELSGGPFLPGDVDYFKATFKAEFYKRLFNSNRIALYYSTDVGFIKELTRGTPIPYIELFYMGGNGMRPATTPLRGYEDAKVGPKHTESDGTIREIGGNVMAKHTLELRAALALEPMPIYVLAFAEAGNVWENINKADMFDLRRSYGLGARILINPIGLIGFDYGYGVDRHLTEAGMAPKWEFHFQFGRGGF